MDNKGRFYQDNDNMSELVTLISYTILSVILSGETILMKWELWVEPLLYIGLICAWVTYVVRAFNFRMRIWIYAILMMFNMFFYGIHLTSTFDLAPVMGVVMMIFAIVDIKGIIYMAMVNYYIIMFCNLIQVIHMKIEFDSLGVTRSLLHLLLVFMFGKIALVFLKRNTKERELYDEIIKDLEDTNRRTEDFLTNVSHEFRTPINAVTGVTSVLLNKVKEKAILKDVLAIQTAGYRLLEQVGDILDYTEIETGNFTLSEDVYMITSVVNDIVVEKRLYSDKNDIELVINVEPDIPAQMYGDGTAIKKIIKNLIDNSYKFTREGGIYVHIYALKKPYGANLCIEVTDTGIGIESTELKRIKERFYQVNSNRNRRAGGLGLGLSVVYGLARLMDGFVKIDSVKDEGTTVHVSIPQKVADSTPSVAVSENERYCIAYYVDFEKYNVPKVREFYQETILEMVEGFGVALYNTDSYDGLMDLLKKYKIGHVFIGSEEYVENATLINKLADDYNVVAFVRQGTNPYIDSRIKSIKMPFYSLSIAQALTLVDFEDDEYAKHMSCPDVKALVVDDEPMNLMVAKELFKDYGMEVTTALSGIEAIDICSKERFDIIFMDHMMPDMDGIETMKKIRELESGIGKGFTIVALTANAVSGAREMFINEGFDGFVAKPVDSLELERVLKRVLPEDRIVYDESKDIVPVDETADDNDTLAGPKDLFTVLEEAGVDVASGVNYSGGSKDFYVKVLAKYVEEASDKVKLIEEYRKNKDYENYKIQVHAIKSTSKMVGIGSIFDKALALENAAKESDETYINDNHKDLVDSYEEIVKIISDAM